MRRTKIICTLGPSSESEEMITKLCNAGMNVARLNFSHGTHEEHKVKIDRIKKVRKELDYPLAIMLDTKGPEYRVGVFENKKALIPDGAEFTFTTEDITGDEHRVSVSYKNLPNEVKVGDQILVNDGLLIFKVKKITDTEIICDTVTGGVLSDRKSMNFPEHVLQGDYLSENDKSDLLFGIENDVDLVAASFVSTKDDVQSLRDFLDKNGGEDIDIIAKIENQSGVDNIDGICEVADGIMVARGDLGVEIPYKELTVVQKQLIHKCRMIGKTVITATEMLESMINNPRPTRAEISDVSNAVYDGSTAIMLSGETAAGKYPVHAVETMSDIAEYTEDNINYKKDFIEAHYVIKNSVDALSRETCTLAMDTSSKGIVISSITGKTIRFVSRFRCPIPIVGLTVDEKAYRKLSLNWGVIPVRCEEFDSADKMLEHASKVAKEILNLEKDDKVILTGGEIGKNGGSTNTIRLEVVE